MIYLDYNATTPVHENVISSMIPIYSTDYGNASNIHNVFGLRAAKHVEASRRLIAENWNVTENEIFFTSGATESINWSIKQVFRDYASKGNHIVVSKTEHKAVLSTCEYLEKNGAEITYLNVDENGHINLIELENSITDKTILVVIMWCNNETGVIQPISEIANICHNKQTLFLSDATQMVGKEKIDLQETRIDIMPFSAHKIYGPKGIGGVYMRRKNPRVMLSSFIHGGSQEKGRRAGTLNVPGIVGMAKAIDGAYAFNRSKEIKMLRDKVEKLILDQVKNADINGGGSNRIFNVSNILLPNIVAEKMVALCPNLAFSLGSACTSERKTPSHVLVEMGRSKEEAISSLRLSFGIYNRIDEAQEIVDTLVKAYNKLKS